MRHTFCERFQQESPKYHLSVQQEAFLINIFSNTNFLQHFLSSVFERSRRFYQKVQVLTRLSRNPLLFQHRLSNRSALLPHEKSEVVLVWAPNLYTTNHVLAIGTFDDNCNNYIIINKSCDAETLRCNETFNRHRRVHEMFCL